MRLVFETPIKLPFEKVRDQFNKNLFIHLSPSFIPFNLKRFDGCKTGDEYFITIGPSVLKLEWQGIITFEETNARGWSFIDEGKVLPWPLKNWKHHHRVDKISDTECRIVDDISFECFSSVFNILMKPFLWATFAIRPGRYQSYFKE
jgi:ligand-binding SRPBCC domain-containing protein